MARKFVVRAVFPAAFAASASVRQRECRKRLSDYRRHNYNFRFEGRTRVVGAWDSGSIFKPFTRQMWAAQMENITFSDRNITGINETVQPAYGNTTKTMHNSTTKR